MNSILEDPDSLSIVIARHQSEGYGRNKSKWVSDYNAGIWMSIGTLIKKKKDNVVEFRAPFEEGPYRLFVYVEDDVEKIAYANVPFFVLPRDKNMKQSRPLQLKKRNLKIVD